MAKHVCPWWLGYLLASPLRRLLSDPHQVLAPHVREGMTVLEPGPGMGFFTMELARLVGPTGRVIAVDVQSKMIQGLRRRLAKAGLLDRVDTRLCAPETMGLADLKEKVDFTLAFAVVHEFPAAGRFFAEIATASKPGATVLFAEPAGHVKNVTFAAELQLADEAGLVIEQHLPVRRSHAVKLRKL